MSGILIYTQKEAERNAFAVNKYKELLGVRLVNERYRGEADFVINRTNDYKIAQYYEKKGIRVFNPPSLSKIANNKQLCYDFAAANGIEIMPTGYKGAPVIKKAVDGKGGTQVYLLERSEPFEEGYVYQKPCDTPGRDLRVWLIGGKIITAVLRTNDSDFRSNYCLGANAVPYELSKSERKLVTKIAELFEHDFIGMDFIFNNGHIVFNEIEDSVGARMVYDKTDIDIIGLYCRYIINCM